MSEILLVQINSQFEAEPPTQSWFDRTAGKIGSSLVIVTSDF